MKSIVFTVALIPAISAFIACSERHTTGQTLPPPPSRVSKTKVSAQEQWATLQKLGFTLNRGVADFNQWQMNKQFEDEPYKRLYESLGGIIEHPPWTPITDRVWDFDAEAIEDHGAYIEIMKNLQRISRGEVRFDNLKDYVDVEEGKAWVSFSFAGKNYKWDLKVDDDWVDPTLFTRVAELTKIFKTKGRYTYFDTGGQNAILGFETLENRDAIIKATGLKIEWLN